MQLNMLNDLAEAMKALDGKKICNYHRSGSVFASQVVDTEAAAKLAQAPATSSKNLNKAVIMSICFAGSFRVL